MTFDRVRELFPGLKDKTYLNFAGQALLNTRAKQAIESIMHHYMHHGSLSVEDWKKLHHNTHQLLSWLLNVEEDEVAFMPNTSRGLLVAMSTIPFEQGDNVIVQKKAFPSLVYPWTHAAVPAVEVRWALSEPQNLVDEINAMVDARTKAVFCDWVHFATGQMIDLGSLSQLAHDKGLFLVVDGTQGLGAVFPDLSDLRVDFWVNSCAKWLLGVEGSGFIYVSSRIMDRLLPGEMGWLSGEYQSYSKLFPMPEPKPGAGRFQEGTRNIFGLVSVSAGIGLIKEFGKKNIRDRIKEITQYVVNEALSRGLELACREPLAGIVSFKPKTDPVAYYETLTQNKVVVSLREGFIRVSPHYFNTKEEVQKVFL